MEGRSFSSGSHSYKKKKSELDGECYYYCGLPSPRRTSWTRLNPGRRFHGCDRYREGSKCKYFKWVDKKFSDRATEVILELLEGRNQPPPALMDELEDVDSMQAQMKGLTSLVDHLKREVSRLKIERNFYRALIVFLFSCVVYSNVKLSNEKKFVCLP
ncbi:hypothetical protein ACJRO7_017541 [Eucalyptus globulus]|uniref:GRF-type domain-containing protein n=1 Tax=Eucalyptus globulus TaxID=34317 RepID=A0ABD3KXJ3_EUCGL